MSQQALYQVLGMHGYRVTQIERDEKRLRSIAGRNRIECAAE